MRDAFSHISTWVFDLDNTLYPPEARLFDQIEVRMTDWVARTLNITKTEADGLRTEYWHKYGTTLAGLMEVHGADPLPYLEDVHEISLEHLAHDALLAASIEALPGRRVVYTNGSRRHAERVLQARGLTEVFHAVYGVEHANFRPKPEIAAFEAIFARDGIEPTRAAMFEDEPRNLEAPHALGMATVHVGPEPVTADFIHHSTNDLAGFLSQVA
ncbi:MAG: pyrimidine 5'-nucleotidase [Boseongicola sp.]|nr:pyrimidine 5'-nucleotidase [Boseongicola sp.]MDD9977068.1 pyrimidine 5'-nucleotidase [Boseongicola sp.]